MASDPRQIPVPSDAPDDAASVQLRYSRYVLMPKSGDAQLYLFMFPQSPAYGYAVPIRIPDKTAPGLTWIGDIRFSLGPEWVFAAGNDVETRHPGRDKYVVLTYQELSDFGRHLEPKIRISPFIYGLGVNDSLQFRFEMKIDGKVIEQSGWQEVPNFEFATRGLKPGNGILSVYVRNDNSGETVYSTDVVLRSIQPIVLSLTGH
jgi:hypothetical protein